MPPQIKPREESNLMLPKQDDAVVIVTPYSTGCCVALDMQERGYKLICLWSAGFSETMKTHQPSSCKSLKYNAILQEQEADTIQDTAKAVQDVAVLNNWNIIACVCGGEAGVDTADALSEYLGLLTNGTSVANRRDKKVQQELAKAHGLRSVRQASGNTLEDVDSFLESETYPIIVKPLDSAGSDGVAKCNSYKEAKEHFQKLIGSEMVNGGVCEEVLCQEFLSGPEYVVDCVSRNGIHKTVMVWLYDKKAVNGGDFVYFGDIPMDPQSPEALKLIPYAHGVLDSLKVKNGPSHAEIILTKDGPCLVEMNVRAHGGDGNWRGMCQTMTGGYDQVSATVDAYLDEEAFLKLPVTPPSPLLAAGQCVDLVSYTSGKVKATPGYEVIKNLPSFVCLETHIGVGTQVQKTVDMSTDAGSCVLMHKDPAVLESDIAVIRQLEQCNAMFEFETNDHNLWEERRQQFVTSKATSLDFGSSNGDIWDKRRMQFLSKPCSLEFMTTTSRRHRMGPATRRRILSSTSVYNSVFEGV